MDSTKYLLIGGGLASGQAAKQLRSQEPEARITLVGEEPYAPYDRPPLSKEFMRGEKAGNEFFFEPPQYFEEHHIDKTSPAFTTCARLMTQRASRLRQRRVEKPLSSAPVSLESNWRLR